MTRLLLLAALAVSACSSSATPPTVLSSSSPTSECEEQRYFNDGRERVCEIRTFTVEDRALRVNAAPNGSIHVTAWDQDHIEVSAQVEAWAESENEARDLVDAVEIEQARGLIRTRLPDLDRRSGRRQPGASASYSLRVPRDAELDLASVNGAIVVEGVQGSLLLDTVNGPLTLTDVGGSVTGETTNGPVDVSVDRVPAGGMDLETTNGPVTLDVGADADAQVDARTSRGPIRIQGLPLEDEGCLDRQNNHRPCMKGRVMGTLGQGGAPLRLRTTNGPMTLRRR